MIKVIDNFMPEEYLVHLQTYMLSPNFLWSYTPCISKDGVATPTIKNAIDSPAFTHKLYSKWEDHKSYAFKVFEPLVTSIENYLDNTQELIRLRAVLTPYKHGFTSQNFNLPHIDFPCPHLSCVYYVNDSDGDTWMFDQYFQANVEPTEYTVKQRITPKPNRLLIFDGLQYHTASNPVNADSRLILNFNFVQKGTNLHQERLKYLNSIKELL